jgi:hypothetical protein
MEINKELKIEIFLFFFFNLGKGNFGLQLEKINKN